MASESKEGEPERNLDPDELPTMRGMYAIINIIDLLHDIIPSRGGPGADVVQNLTLGDDIDFKVLYRLIPDGPDRRGIIEHYNAQPPVYATLRNLLLDIAYKITRERVSIEDAGCICIGEIKRQFGYFGDTNPYLSYEEFAPKDIMKSEALPESFRFKGPSETVLERILRLNRISHWFTEATGNAQIYLSKSVRGIGVKEAIAVASGVDPGQKISGDPENNSSYNLSEDPVLGEINVRFNEGKYTIEFGDATFSGIVIDRLPNTCLATAIASLIPNLMRHITNWRRPRPPPKELIAATYSEGEYLTNSQRSNSSAAAVPLNPQTMALPPFEEYLQGKAINGDTIETHIRAWLIPANINSLTSKKALNYLIKLVKTYIMNATKSGRADIKEYDEYDPAYNPEDRVIEEEEKEAIAAFSQFIRDLCDEQSSASDAGGKAKRARICDVECDNLDKNELINICKLALAILKKCLSTRGTFKDRIQMAIKTILRLKSWGDRLQMEELMTLIGNGETCAIASKDKLFLANCILYANITGRHIITVEYFNRGENYFMSIINHDGSRGASLTPEQIAVRERERAAAEAERAAEKAKRNKEAADARQSKAKELAAKRSERNIILQEELYPPRTSFRRESQAPIEAKQPRSSQRIAALREPQLLNGHRCDNGAPWRYNLIRAPGNGSCLFGAIIIAMLRMYTQDGEAELRRRVVNFMRNNREIYNDPTILGLFGVALDTYINRMENDGVWGGLTEIITVEMMLGQCINVWIYNDENECYELWYGNGNPNCLNILYNGYNHYDALLPVDGAPAPPLPVYALGAASAAAAAAPPETPEQRRAKIVAALKERGFSPRKKGGFRSHRQRKTLKKRKGKRHTRRRT